MESQGRGLALALGTTPVVIGARLRAPWNHVPPDWLMPPLRAVRDRPPTLAPPWPDILISCGRRSVGLALRIRRLARGRTFAVHIQDPHVDPLRFDLVAAPRHDGLRGENVIVTRAALHPFTRERLDEAASFFAPALQALPRPLVAVLIGGSNRRYRMTPRLMGEIGARLRALSDAHGAGLAVTPSRRTGPAGEAALRHAIEGAPAVIWDGTPPNPYLGYLGLADAVVVTADSVSMVSEACATGKPVYVVELEGGSKRFRRFHDALRADGLTRPFTGELEAWSYTPPDDARHVAEAVRRRMAARATHPS